MKREACLLNARDLINPLNEKSGHVFYITTSDLCHDVKIASKKNATNETSGSSEIASATSSP